MAPEAEHHEEHHAEIIEEFPMEEHMLEQATPVDEVGTQKRHGRREYTSENGPLVHRDNRGRHIEFRADVRQVRTPSQILEIEKHKQAILSGAKLG
ncbi:MAG: hypothetical protein Unbinned92contig1002_51 [Prokaryotic dsDNA virus sp.]|nr:MAG: hypothetical protein Unbinned92contig1002_51 [Prokaryotic dsDNA virus sp.]|tara:strand:- start:14088 stop:14375 length:288 start_codon:yes stop_codon:yes gene_type:complete